MKTREALRMLTCVTVGVALGAALPQFAGAREGLAAAVLFAPTGEARKIHAAIKGELGRGRKSIDVAMFNFTSTDLSRALIAAKQRGVRVRVLVDGKSAKAINITKDRDLAKAGVTVKRVKLKGSGVRAAKFHHKFAVIDGVEVISGSYNWTVSADEKNYENLLVLRDKRLAASFAAEFEKIWKDDSLTEPVK